MGTAFPPLHVKWFENPEPFGLRTDLIFSERTALLVGISALVVLVLYLLQRWLGDPHWPRVDFLHRMAIGAPTLLAVQAAVGLIHAAVQPSLFVPNMPLHVDALGLTLAALQIFVAFAFITGLLDWLAAIVLVLLGPLAFFLFHPVDVLDQLLWVGIGLVMFVIGRYSVEGATVRPWLNRADGATWWLLAVDALRIITGLSFLILALSEKLWNPDLARAFLESYPHLNLVQSVFGIQNFSHDQFALMIGLTEGAIGIALVSGLLTRVVILGMVVPFNLGVPFLPPQELIGHLPIFGIMYFLLIHSSGITPGEPLTRLHARPHGVGARP